MTLPTPPHKIPGHFYSPIVDTEAVAADADRIWPSAPEVPGLNFRPSLHQHFLRDVFPRYIDGYDYPEEGVPDAELGSYYTRNDQFSWLDSRAAFCLLRHIAPSRIVEVGSGYTSLLMADVNRRFLRNRCRITCIEPYPRPFLKRSSDMELIEMRVQDVSLSVFDSLGPEDVLFIDSSHVVKTGSDVAFLMLQVLPRLKAGVLIHVHDIFLPEDYPRSWVVDMGISWNEQYVLQALLAHNPSYGIVFSSTYAACKFPELVTALVGKPLGGSSLWIERRSKHALQRFWCRLARPTRY